MKLIAALLALALSGCVTGTIKTPYGTITRTAAGKTTIELDVRGFAK